MIVMEIVGPSYRTAIGCVIQISLSVGFMLQPLIANFVRDEVKYQLAALGPNIIFFSFVLWVMNAYVIPKCYFNINAFHINLNINESWAKPINIITAYCIETLLFFFLMFWYDCSRLSRFF